jgi:hypothetical protein
MQFGLNNAPATYQRCIDIVFDLCERYKQYENFWTDEDGILYRQELTETPRVVIPATLIPTVLT